MSDDLVEMARLAQHDERMSTGALYGDLADRIEELEAKLAEAEGSLNICSVSWGECNRILDETKAKLAQQDDLDAAVAAALREAVEAVRSQHGDPDNENGIALAEAAILALIPDAGKALERALAAQREKDAKIAETCPDSHWGPFIAAAIRKGGE